MTPEKEEILKVILDAINQEKQHQKEKGCLNPKFTLRKRVDWQKILMEKVIEMHLEGKTKEEIIGYIPISVPTVKKYIRGYQFKNKNEQLVKEGKRAIPIEEVREENKLISDVTKGLNTEARIKILSQLAADLSMDASTRISAIRTLNDLASQTGDSSRFLLEIGVNKKSMANYLAMLGIDKKQIVSLLAINDVEEIHRKMAQLEGSNVAIMTTECFNRGKIEDRVIAKGEKGQEEEEVDENDIMAISRGIDPVPLAPVLPGIADKPAENVLVAPVAPVPAPALVSENHDLDNLFEDVDVP